jgi:hypothetical protein
MPDTMYRVVVTCSTGGWVFWFATKDEARAYAKEIRRRGNRAKVEQA